MLFAQSGEYRYLERASRDVAKASAVLVQLEIERMELFNSVAPSTGRTITLTDLSRGADEAWQASLAEMTEVLRSHLAKITELQQKVKAVCQEKIEIIDSTLTLLGSNHSVYDATGHKSAIRQSILSESA